MTVTSCYYSLPGIQQFFLQAQHFPVNSASAGPLASFHSDQPNTWPARILVSLLSAPQQNSAGMTHVLVFLKMAPRIQGISVSCPWQASEGYIYIWTWKIITAENLVFADLWWLKFSSGNSDAEMVSGHYSKGAAELCPDTTPIKRAQDLKSFNQKWNLVLSGVKLVCECSRWICPEWKSSFAACTAV